MRKQQKIPVHRMEERFSGVYVAPLALEKSSTPGYEISQPHRHDFYYCVLLERGKMQLEVDFQQVQISDQSLFLSYPGQIHQINAARMERGWFLAFDPSMLDEQLKTILDQCLSEVILVPVSPEKSADLSSLIHQLYKIYDDQSQLFRQTITQSMVTALVYQIASAYLSIERFNLIRHSTRSIEITKRFKQLLRHHFKSMKKPSEYAAKMNITSSYLNDIVRSVTGFSVTYYIQHELMREAQRLLYHSDLAVKEIADTLGFEDAKYFNRLFSKIVGVSPGLFRKQSETSVHFTE
ncbi:AraC family transcriptional regulator [Chitinophaga pinensis]|uniref:Transcriptional regulator, AraC family n=1 Tax=Chitinophaga pinensis (strain ATCC 43595 / DSM 2588 / LMG 13176 / NBRC 15968 / NCIMB 11800 / UQM 2034) TaxID=485918 RepID=A0A979G5K9_CHIPD|nr:helix-turn-helix transcriptional regulator [Chitinophaga pinensis]ACU61259.1 transcriptional regulator, AraC family [Chitinophaga pinensis DSM 2588]